MIAYDEDGNDAQVSGKPPVRFVDEPIDRAGKGRFIDLDGSVRPLADLGKIRTITTTNTNAPIAPVMPNPNGIGTVQSEGYYHPDTRLARFAHDQFVKELTRPTSSDKHGLARVHNWLIDQDDRVRAFSAILDHPLFDGVLGKDGKLIDHMLERLDEVQDALEAVNERKRLREEARKVRDRG